GHIRQITVPLTTGVDRDDLAVPNPSTGGSSAEGWTCCNQGKTVIEASGRFFDSQMFDDVGFYHPFPQPMKRGYHGVHNGGGRFSQLVEFFGSLSRPHFL